MKRREFIGIAGAGALSMVLPAYGRPARGFPRAFVHPRLLEILHGEAIVRALGRRYRELVAVENDANTLATVIAGAERPDAIQESDLEEQIRNDFAASRTVTLDGWILSVTEARQCALYSLLPA